MNLKLLFRLFLFAAVVAAQTGCASTDAADNTTVGEPSMMTHEDDSHGWGTHVGQVSR